MKASSHKESQYAMVNSLESLMASADAINHILSSAVDDLLKLQAESSESRLPEAWPNMAAPHSPDAAAHALWQVPTFYQTQSRRMVKTMLDSFSILSRTQQQLLDCAVQSISCNILQTTNQLTRITGVVASRRLAGEVISFANRRANEPAVSHEVKVASSSS